MKSPDRTARTVPNKAKQNYSALLARATQAESEHEEEFVPPETLREEKLRYNQYYDRIYPWVRGNKLNYEKMAEATSLSRRRVRECLLFRLGGGQIRNVFGHEPGYCFVCKIPLRHKKSTEPVCLQCLQTIDSFLNKTGSPASIADSSLSGMAPSDSLKTGLEDSADPADSDVAHSDEAITAEILPATSAEEILAILEEEEEPDESDLGLDTTTLADVDAILISSHQNAPVHLKHYGFKRLKRPPKK